MNSTALLSSFNTNTIPYLNGGSTNLPNAMIELRQNVMSSAGGDRTDVPNVCVLLTTSISILNMTGYLPEANLTKSVCKLIIIGAGSFVSKLTLFHSNLNSRELFANVTLLCYSLRMYSTTKR